MTGEDFEHALAAANLMPGPASTQLAIFCAWRLRRTVGALVGGLCFIVPGLIVILALSVLFLASNPPLWVAGAAAGAGAAVPAVALGAALGLAPASWRRTPSRPWPRVRWIVYVAIGATATIVAGSLVVVALLACGVFELARSRAASRPPGATAGLVPPVLPVLAALASATGGLAALAWVAIKVGALSFGGGFVIVPLMQADAVHRYHWMTNAQFLNAVALGQITPGPVVQTVAAVGYAAGGIGAGLLAALVAFTPSFAFVLAGAPHFERFRASASAQAFLGGAGPAAIGAIAGSAVPLGLALSHAWQVPVLAGAAVWLLAARRGVVSTLLLAGGIGILLALAGVAISA
jgi:chromate transporter